MEKQKKKKDLIQLLHTLIEALDVLRAITMLIPRLP